MKKHKGQTLLMMLYIMGFVVVILSATLVLSVAGLSITVSGADAIAASYGAESGLENGLIKFLRDPEYQGETLTVGRATVTISLTGSGPYTIVATSTAGSSQRVSQANIQINSGVMTVNGWRDNY